MTAYLNFFIIVAAVTFLSESAFGQTGQTVQKVSDSRLIAVLNDLSILSEKQTDDLSIRVFKTGNISGSAGQPSSEITHNIYVAVSEHDEVPEQALHTYGPVFSPKVVGWTASASAQILTIEFGPASSRKQVKLKISIADMTVVK